MKKYFLFHCFAFFLTMLCLSGCNEISDSMAERNVCRFSGSVNSFDQRSANPSSFKNSTFTYVVKAFKDSEENSVLADMDGRNFSFTLEYGTWNIKADVYTGGKLIMKNISQVVLDSPEVNILIESLAIVQGPQNSQVSISITKASDSSSKFLIAEWKGDNGNIYKEKVSIPGTFKMTGDSNSFCQDGKVPSGSYDVSFYVKDNSDVLVCFFREKINVYPEFKTDVFSKTSNPCINSSGNIHISKDCEINASRKEFYVSPSSGKNGSGSRISPLKNIQSAVDFIETVNDGASAYTIILLEDVHASEDDGEEIPELGKTFVNINPDKKLNLTFSSENQKTISGEGTTLRGFYIGNNAEVNFNNIIIQDFYAAVKGCEAYITGNCILSGSSRLGHTYLSSNSSIKLDSSYNFSDTAMKNELFLEEFDGQYQTGSQILKGAVSAETKQNFTVRMSPDGSIYFINDSGILEKGPENVSSLLQDASGNFCISNRKELEFVRDTINAEGNIQGTQPAKTASYILIDDIDLMNMEWDGIGTYAYNSFEGTFDGNNHSIKNLCLKDQTNSGLFRYLKNAEIKNIKDITGNSVMTKTTAGAVAAVCAGGKVVIRNVCSSVNISSSSDDTGGFVGELSITGTELVIINCINRGNITSNSNAGGFIGNVFDTNSNIIKIYNSVNFGNIEITSETGGAGGLIGKLQSDLVEVINAYNSGIITGLTFQKLKNGVYGNITNAGNLFGVVSVNLETNAFVNYFYYYEGRATKIIGDDADCGYHIQAETLPIREVFENHTLKSPVEIDGTEYSSLLSALNCPYIQTVISGRNPVENYSTKTWTLDSESKIVLVE